MNINTEKIFKPQITFIAWGNLILHVNMLRNLKIQKSRKRRNINHSSTKYCGFKM